MQVHTLQLDDFCEDQYTLIGIHTTLEDYKLAYLLNKELKTKFFKANFNLDFQDVKNNASFSVYNFKNTKYDSDWHLIANIYNEEKSITNSNLLFSSTTRTYLIPEKKNIDFFIKMMGETETSFIYETINKIKKIPEVITSYSIDLNTLKSKNSLIL